MEKQPLLEIKNLVTEFHTEEALVMAVNDISFTLHKGETIGIVGESGSGKTTLAMAILRLSSSTGKIGILNSMDKFNSPAKKILLYRE